ncbi:MAG: hypothetical protein J6Z23_05880 [Lachnospiraceae bacterium]|nr:hypothetical protein [Lachnospiraceae bacterium]
MKQARIILLVFSIIAIAVFAVFRIRDLVRSDDLPPVITADTDTLVVSVSVTDRELLSGLRASDNKDGDVTGSIFVVSRSRFISPGTLQVNYAAFDSSDNVGTYVRTVHFTDYEPPRFYMTAPFRFPEGNSSYNYMRDITARDTLDGDLTGQIKIARGGVEVLNEDVTVRMITLQVTNSAGDSAVLEIPARFESYTVYAAPAPALSDYICYTKAGTEPDYRSLLSGIYTAGNTRSFEQYRYDPDRDIRIDASGVDAGTPGMYEAYYTLYSLPSGDSEPEALGTASLIVIVEE